MKGKAQKKRYDSKRLRNIIQTYDTEAFYAVDQALNLVKKNSSVKFDETVEVVFGLGVDPRHSDQAVRGTVALPAGLGKKITIAVFAKDQKATEAKALGADFVGSDDLIDQVKKGQINFDRCVATPDMMVALASVARILGPRGLMPNPKTGTVTNDLEQAIKALQAGQVTYKTDKGANVHVPIGKVSFSVESLLSNFTAIYDSVLKAKPQTSKGNYIKHIYVSSTMGPSVRINPKLSKEELSGTAS